MDVVIKECFDHLMRGEYARRAISGFTRNLNLMGHAPVPDEVRDYALTISKSKTHVQKLSHGRPFHMAIHDAQFKYIARGVFCALFPPDSPNSSVLNRIGFSKINKTRYEKLRKKVRVDYAIKTLASFYKREEKISWWSVFAQVPTWCVDLDSEIKVIYKFAMALKDAMAPKGMKTLPNQYRTPDVLSIIRGIRKSEDFGGMAILADALEEAGFQNEVILNHYRDGEAVFTFGSWIFKATGNLEFTSGTGTDKPDTTTPADGS